MPLHYLYNMVIVLFPQDLNPVCQLTTYLVLGYYIKPPSVYMWTLICIDIITVLQVLFTFIIQVLFRACTFFLLLLK